MRCGSYDHEAYSLERTHMHITEASAIMDDTSTQVMGVLRTEWPGQLNSEWGLRKDFMERMVTFELSQVSLWFTGQRRSGKDVLGRGNCLGKGTEVKRGLA